MSEGIHIVVCIKQVPDPEAPAASFKVNSETKTILADGVPPVMNPYDESALEVALRIKETQPDVRITVVSFGPKLAKAVLLKALAVGADELYMIEDQSVDADGHVTARILSSVLEKIGFDLVLAGRQASDSNSGVVGLALAEMLSVPAVSWARKIGSDADHLVIERVIPDGFEVLRGPMPALVTISHEAGELRSPKLPDMRKARQKPIHRMSVADFETDRTPERLIDCIRLEPPQRERSCRFIEGDSPAEAGISLGKILIEEGILNI